MKNIFKFMGVALMASTLLFCGCDKEEEGNNNNTPVNPGNGGNDDAMVTFTMGSASWEQEGNVFYATYHWNAKLKDASLKLRTFTEEGKEYCFGIGYAPVGAENGKPQYFNGDKPENVHELVYANNDSTEFTFRSRVKADNKKEARAFVYLSDGQFHYSNMFYIDPAEFQGGGGDIGVAMPEMVSNTATSITMESHFTGNITGADQFRNASCGFVWCLDNGSALNLLECMNQGNYIDCTQSAWMNNGQRFEGTVTGLTENTRYTVAAWLRMTPESEPVFSDWRALNTSNGGGGHDDTNWVQLVEATPINESTISVTVTAYFDGDPIAVGVVYSTTNEVPTLNDNVYNAFDHIDMQTFTPTDATIQNIQINNDGSRTVTALLTNLQSGTFYYIRGYAQLTTGAVIYSPNGSGVQTD